MGKTLKDFILAGGILNRDFICAESEKNPRYCGSEFSNKPYKVDSLSCYQGEFSIYVKFYNNSRDGIACLNLATSLNDPEATQQQIDDAKKEREDKLNKIVSSK